MIIVPRNEQALGQRPQHEDRGRRAAEADRLRDGPSDDRQGRADLRARGRQDALALRDADADHESIADEFRPRALRRGAAAEDRHLRRRRRRARGPVRLHVGPDGRLDADRRVGHPPAVAQPGHFVRRWSRTACWRAQRERPRVRVDAGGSALRPADDASARSVWDQRLAAEGYTTQAEREDCAARDLGVPRRPAGHHRPRRQLSGPSRARTRRARRRSRFRSTARPSSAGASWGSPRSSRSSICSTRSTRSDPSAATPRRWR